MAAKTPDPFAAIPENIAALQARYSLSVDDMAKAFGIKRTAYYSRLKAPRNFKLYELDRAARYLRVSLYDLLERR